METGSSSFTRVFRQLAPFAITALGAWVAVLIGQRISWLDYGVSLALLAVSWTYGVWTGLNGHMRAGTVLGSLGFLAAVAVLRNAAGGSTSGVSIVSLLAVFQTALYVHDRRALWIVLVGLLAFYLAPLLIVGPPQYPHSGYRSALFAVAVSSIIGLVTHGLVANIRRRAREARHRERLLVRINEIVQQLFESASPRADACEAARDICDAAAVALCELRPGSTQTLRLTTSTTGIVAPPPNPNDTVGHPMFEAFRSHKPVLITRDVESKLLNTRLWRAGGAPRSILFQPLLRGDEAVGVMVVTWREEIQPDAPCVIIASLLGREVAAVIGRADVIEQLTDDALTDPLTGLPNRRAWNAALERALGQQAPVAVAMLDIDFFKQFNDNHGHPAGDRLLREAAAAWRSEMRARDFLARLGGEEFALLLTGDDAQTVTALVERLRARMPEHQTCSAGIALRHDGDTPDALLSRADQALYAAKQGGRNRSVFSEGNDPA